MFASDLCKDALEAHALNHPNATHVALSFPQDEQKLLDALPNSDSLQPWHLHGSPPCTKLSKANLFATEDDKNAAVCMSMWFLHLAVEKCNPTSFSFEQVAAPELVKAVERFRLCHHRKFAYAVLQFEEFGVPQMRKRIVGGSPWLISNLLRQKGTFPSHLSHAGHWIGSKHCKEAFLSAPNYNGRTKVFDKRKIRKLHPSEFRVKSLHEPAHTVTCRSPLEWVSKDGNKMGLLDPYALARLQTFPKHTVFPNKKVLSRRLIGNALPPRIATLLLQNYSVHNCK